ncbi:hypothetical protein D2Q93_07375 [Alicyclobacillaceae bacterium I2511]|jgi:hypothetical protein|nr:hypothetical protein D2Q93_07375 [Alicyclobacillaceae bacterium I2511]
MWEIMNGMANNVRGRVMPRRRNGVNTMTAVLVGASVGIAAWEAIRRSRFNLATTIAKPEQGINEMLEQLDD